MEHFYVILEQMVFVLKKSMNNILFQFTQPNNDAVRSNTVDSSDYRWIVDALHSWMNNPLEIS